ncbi:MAG TPA: P27 family phage terminase small subunit [Euzebyales bacterium]
MTSTHLRAPDDLSDASRRLFRRLVADRRALGGVAEVDALLLADALRLRERLAQVRAQLAVDGPTVAGSKGQTRPHPLIAAEQNLARDVRAAFDQLQLSPSKRPDVTEVDSAGRLVDPFAGEYDDE